MGGGSITRRLQGNGKVAVNDGALTNAELIKKVQQVTARIGLSKEQGAKPRPLRLWKRISRLPTG